MFCYPSHEVLASSRGASLVEKTSSCGKGCSNTAVFYSSLACGQDCSFHASVKVKSKKSCRQSKVIFIVLAESSRKPQEDAQTQKNCRRYRPPPALRQRRVNSGSTAVVTYKHSQKKEFSLMTSKEGSSSRSEKEGRIRRVKVWLWMTLLLDS